MPDEGIHVLERRRGNVLVKMPERYMSYLRLAERGTHPGIRHASEADIDRVLQLEATAFSGDNSTLDPAETHEGIRAFLKNKGEILLLYRDTGFLERMPLAQMLEIDYGALDENSPLRQIAGRRELLGRAWNAYKDRGKEAWYIHGVGNTLKGNGDGSRLMVRALRDVAEEERIHFGYIDIGPVRDNINTPSFRLFFKRDCVADGWEDEVYSPGVPYMRISHGAGYELGGGEHKVDLGRRTYKHQLREALAEGYLGVGLTRGTSGTAKEMIFRNRLP
ncbi:MAG: hypothetical protein HYT73_04415 [Candidatus Aenigmarchaeota archaeon]|nr:hypothetical protein [Candidatus Aenigmarchaeota archaeon]